MTDQTQAQEPTEYEQGFLAGATFVTRTLQTVLEVKERLGVLSTPQVLSIAQSMMTVVGAASDKAKENQS